MDLMGVQLLRIGKQTKAALMFAGMSKMGDIDLSVLEGDESEMPEGNASY
jgi:hypothetical protein